MGGGEPFISRYECKEAMYNIVHAQIRSLIDGANPKVPHASTLTTNLANVSSVLFYALNALASPEAQLQHLPVNWVGFYLLVNPQLLVLGPFQGKVACTEIKVGKGVCGTAVLSGKSQCVVDVHEFPGHIACDSESVSEVVIPIRNKEHRIVGVLDIDSTQRAQFDDVDVQWLEKICADLGEHLHFASSVMAQSQPLGAPDAPPAPRRPGGVPTAVITSDLAVLQRPIAPNTKVKTIAGWELRATDLNRMVSQARVSELEKELGVAALPEIMFEHNAIEFTHIASKTKLAINLVDALRSAAAFYKSDAFAAIKDELAVPTADIWKAKSAKVFDASIDWAFRNDYRGSWTRGGGAAPALPTTRDIDIAMLRDTSLEILFFDSLVLFEDDLHDFGVSKMTLKFRAMQPCFFCLLRHFIRIDRVGATAVETRIFHKFGESHAVVETVTKSVGNAAGKIDPLLEGDLQSLGEDELCMKMTTKSRTVVEIELSPQ